MCLAAECGLEPNSLVRVNLRSFRREIAICCERFLPLSFKNLLKNSERGGLKFYIIIVSELSKIFR